MPAAPDAVRRASAPSGVTATRKIPSTATAGRRAAGGAAQVRRGVPGQRRDRGAGAGGGTAGGRERGGLPCHDGEWAADRGHVGGAAAATAAGGARRGRREAPAERRVTGCFGRRARDDRKASTAFKNSLWFRTSVSCEFVCGRPHRAAAQRFGSHSACRGEAEHHAGPL